MSPKYHIAKRKYISDVLQSIFGTIFVFIFMFSLLSEQIDEETIDLGLTEFYVLIVITILALVAQLVVRWLILRKHTFTDQEKSFFVEKGLFFKRKASIPYKNIHTISIKRRLLELILGLSTIEIDTGSTASFQAEGRLVLDKNYALVLKEYLENKKFDDTLVLPSPHDFVVSTKTENNSHSLKWYQLLLLGVMKPLFLSSMVGTIVSILGVGSITIQLADDLSFSENFMEMIYLCLGALLFSTITTMLYHFFKYYKYRYTIEQGYITYSYGLLKRAEFKTPIKRINAVHLNQSLLFRIFGYYQLNVSILGVGELSDGEQLKVESKSILPFAKLDEVKDVLSHIDFMTSDYHQEVLPNKFKYLNFMVLPLVAIIILNLIPYIIFQPRILDFIIPLILQLLFIFGAFIATMLSLKQHKIQFNNNEFLFQRGAFTLKKTIVKKLRIQLISYKQNPLLLLEKIGNIFVAYKDILGIVVMKNFEKTSFDLVKNNFLNSLD